MSHAGQRAETDYRALAKERQAAALRGRERAEAQARLAANADRLFRWRRVDRKYAARAVGWARDAIWSHCR